MPKPSVYPRYKPTPIPWIGQVPSIWRTPSNQHEHG